MQIRAAAYWIMNAIHNRTNLQLTNDWLNKPKYKMNSNDAVIEVYNPNWMHQHIMEPAFLFKNKYYKQIYGTLHKSTRQESGRRQRYVCTALVSKLTRLLMKHGPNPSDCECKGQFKNESLRTFHLKKDTDCLFSTFTRFLCAYLHELHEDNGILIKLPEMHARGKFIFAKKNQKWTKILHVKKPYWGFFQHNFLFTSFVSPKYIRRLSRCKINRSI